MHIHTHCEHKNLKYCGHCNIVYCEDCKSEWVTQTINIPTVWWGSHPRLDTYTTTTNNTPVYVKTGHNH